jgi:hypothetical protein
MVFIIWPLRTKNPPSGQVRVSLSLAKRKNPDYRSGVSFFAFLMRETADTVNHLS